MNTRLALLATVVATGFALRSFGAGLDPGFGVINVIPNSQSGESDQNSEPSIAVGPVGAGGQRPLLVHAFNGTGTNSYYTSVDGGITWTNPGTIVDGDATCVWSPGGVAYAARLFGLAFATVNRNVTAVQGSIDVQSSADAAGGTAFSTVAGSLYQTPAFTDIPDQPWLEVVRVGNADRLYVGINDRSQMGSASAQTAAATASVRYSLDSGGTWSTTIIERTTPGFFNDSPAVRVAAAQDGSYVYAVFLRYNTKISGTTTVVGDVVVVRDDNGNGSFNGLGANGTVVEANITLPVVLNNGTGTFLGTQRLGSDCSIAVSPTDPKKVYVAYAEVIGGTPRVRVRISSDRGQTFSSDFFNTSIASALPALAVAQNGTLGLLYTRLVGFL